MNELRKRLTELGGNMAGEVRLQPFEAEITLPLYTRIDGEEHTVGTVTLPVKLSVELVKATDEED